MPTYRATYTDEAGAPAAVDLSAPSLVDAETQAAEAGLAASFAGPQPVSGLDRLHAQNDQIIAALRALPRPPSVQPANLDRRSVRAIGSSTFWAVFQALLIFFVALPLLGLLILLALGSFAAVEALAP